MAVGDFVNGMITSGTNLDFQPASPNVVCITSFGDWSNYGQMTNGTIVAYLKDHLASAWNQEHIIQGFRFNNSGGGAEIWEMITYG